MKLPRHPSAALRRAARDPAGAMLRYYDLWAERRESRRVPAPHRAYPPADPDWDRHLHAALGLPCSCGEAPEFRQVWAALMAELVGRGLRPGPGSFEGWNDGDAGFARAIWCLVRHLRPLRVVEAGVAHGITTRVILEAMARNGTGRLWSIDDPPLDPGLRAMVGVAVADRGRDRWHFIEGTSRRRLPPLLSEIGAIDLFVHDSLHSTRNVRFELEQAWRALRPGGAAVVDDIDMNTGLAGFAAAHAIPFLVCAAEPLRPDPRRFNGKGLFGIVLKNPPIQAAAAREPAVAEPAPTRPPPPRPAAPPG